MTRLKKTSFGRSWCIAVSFVCMFITAQAQDFYHPFGPDSIWNTRIPSNATYVPANLGVLGGLTIDQEYLYQTYSTDRLVDVLQLNEPSNVIGHLYFPDSLNIPQDGNNAASFVDPNGHTTYEYNAFQRVIGSTYFSSNPYDPVGFAWPGSDIYADDYGTALGGHAGSGMSALGGSIRQGSTENNDLNHALKIELDFGQLYYNPNNPANENGTFRWPATNSDGDFPGQSGNPPGYYGTNPSLAMGSLLAIPPNIDVTRLGLSPTGVLIARALQNYGAYVVDTSGIGSNSYHTNGGYTCNLCVEEGENPGYFVNAINQDNSGSTSGVYLDMSIIYPLLQVVDSNNPPGQNGAITLNVSSQNGQANLTWTSYPGASSYRIYHSIGNDTSYSWLVTGWGSPSYTDSNLASGTTYYYKVSALDSNGNEIAGSISPEQSVTINGGITLSVTSQGGQANLTWTSYPGASSYRIYHSIGNDTSYSWLVTGWGSPSYTDSNLASGTTYYYEVSALDSNGNEIAGSISSEQSVTPP